MLQFDSLFFFLNGRWNHKLEKTNGAISQTLLNLNKKNPKLGGRFEVMFDELIFFMLGGGFQKHFTTYFQIGSCPILTKKFKVQISR